MTISQIFMPSGLFIAGAIAGYAYFTTLRLNIGLFLEGYGKVLGVMLMGVRFSVLGALLWAVVPRGPEASAAFMTGFILARYVSLRRARKAAL